LAAVELRAGHPAVARPLLQRLLAQAPGYPGAAELLGRATAETAPPPAGSVRLRLLRVRERKGAEEALRRAAAGEDFTQLARVLSVDPSATQGGDLGSVRLADLAEPLRSAARALHPGDLSPVLEVDGGYVVLKRER
ncbi:MAG TPA: peptidylprolyl isomerase, partial [Vicinamibacteria bacterium]